MVDNVKKLKKEAENGDGKAMLDLAIYYSQLGERTESERWLVKAANTGQANKIYEIGTAYHYGKGNCEVNLVAASFFYTISAGVGHVDSMFNLGVISFKTNDFEAAKKWFKLAAESGDAEARQRYEFVCRFTSAGGIVVDTSNF